MIFLLVSFKLFHSLNSDEDEQRRREQRERKREQEAAREQETAVQHETPMQRNEDNAGSQLRKYLVNKEQNSSLASLFIISVGILH